MLPPERDRGEVRKKEQMSTALCFLGSPGFHPPALPIDLGHTVSSLFRSFWPSLITTKFESIFYLAWPKVWSQMNSNEPSDLCCPYSHTLLCSGLCLEHSDVPGSSVSPEIPQIHPVFMLVTIIPDSLAPNAYFKQNNSSCLYMYFQIFLKMAKQASKQNHCTSFGNAEPLRIYLHRNDFTYVQKSHLSKIQCQWVQCHEEQF